MFHGHNKRTMATDCNVHPQAKSTAWKVRQTAARATRCSQRHPLDSANRCPMGGFARSISAEKYLPSIFPAVEQIRSLCQDTYGTGDGLERAWRHRHPRRFYRWNVCSCQKRGDGVGKTKKGKGTKIMGLAD